MSLLAHRHYLSLCRALTVMTVATTAAVAQPRDPGRAATTAPASRSLDALIEQLADADPAVRATARAALMDLRPSDLPAVHEAAARAKPLLPSQAVDLRAVVTHLHMCGQTYEVADGQGFLGVSMPPQPDIAVTPLDGPPRVGVAIVGRFPGFDAFRLLEDSDVIVGIDGVADRDDWGAQRFVETVQRIPPGAVVPLRVVRGGRVTTVRVRVSPRPLLANPADRGAFDEMRRQWEDEAEAYWRQHFAPLVVGGDDDTADGDDVS